MYYHYVCDLSSFSLFLFFRSDTGDSKEKTKSRANEEEEVEENQVSTYTCM